MAAEHFGAGGDAIRYLNDPYAGWAKALALAVIVGGLVATGFFVGVVSGRHEARAKADRECVKRHEETAARRGWVLAAFPCDYERSGR